MAYSIHKAAVAYALYLNKPLPLTRLEAKCNKKRGNKIAEVNPSVFVGWWGNSA